MQEQSVQLEEILRESQNLREQVDGTATARTSLLHARYTTATAQLLVQNAPSLPLVMHRVLSQHTTRFYMP